MQAISLRPQQRLLVNKRIALFVLVALIAAFPMLSLPFAMLMLLFACPLMRGSKRWIVLLALPLPSVIVLLYGYHPAYAMGLLLLLGVQTWTAYQMKPKEYAKPASILPYVVNTILFSSIAVWGLYLDAWHEGIGLAAFAADRAEQWLMNHPQRINLIYRALSAGLLPLPEGYERFTVLNLTIDPVFLGQIRLLLKTRVVQFVETTVPVLLVESGVILGVFINLRIQRMWGSYLLLDKEEPQKVHIALAPCFSRLRMPRSWRIVLFVFCLFYFFSTSTRGFGYRMAQIGYAAFETAYQLQGAAVVCHLIMRGKQERRLLAGGAATLLYVIMPFAAFLAGCFDTMFPFRSEPEDDKNEREKNEEEEL